MAWFAVVGIERVAAGPQLAAIVELRLQRVTNLLRQRCIAAGGLCRGRGVRLDRQLQRRLIGRGLCLAITADLDGALLRQVSLSNRKISTQQRND